MWKTDNNSELNKLYKDIKTNKYISELNQLKTLKDNGVITDEEFEAKKKSILFK